MAGSEAPWTETLNFFFLIFGQCGDNYKYNLFLERKIAATERPRSLNPGKAILVLTCVSMHGVACERYTETISANFLKKTLFEPEEFENACFNNLKKEGFKT